jgi:putative tricarboxylic transport membrane protein
MPIVIVIILTGAYSLNNSEFDLAMLTVFGALGYFMKRTGYEPAPLLIGLMLGPTLERGLVQGLIIGSGDIGSLFTRPVSGTILALGVMLLLYNVVRWAAKVKYDRTEVM